MTIRQLLTSSALVLALSAPAFAQLPEPPAPAEPPEEALLAPLPPLPPTPPVVALAQVPEPPNAPPAPLAPDARPRPAPAPKVFRFNGRINGPIDLEALYDQARQAIENSQFDR